MSQNIGKKNVSVGMDKITTAKVRIVSIIYYKFTACNLIYTYIIYYINTYMYIFYTL